MIMFRERVAEDKSFGGKRALGINRNRYDTGLAILIAKVAQRKLIWVYELNLNAGVIIEEEEVSGL